MADFKERFSGAYYSPRGSKAGRQYSISPTLSDKASIPLAGALLNKADEMQSFEKINDNPPMYNKKSGYTDE